MDMDHSKGVHIISKLKYKNIYFPHFMEIDHLKGIFKYPTISLFGGVIVEEELCDLIRQ